MGATSEGRRNGTARGISEPPRLEMSVPAIPTRVREVREAAREFARSCGAAHPDDVAIAMSEVCTNVVHHAYVDGRIGPMHLLGARAGDCVCFTVVDHGGGLKPRPDSPGVGLGLPLIAELSDHFEISDAGGTGTTVRMDFSVDGDGASSAV